ncbi:MAG TPA: cation transporter [Candidatus Dormibacteraeota bacterium]|nr:cation transporter [Candidatus Dormibacteraeota bacterium]
MAEITVRAAALRRGVRLEEFTVAWMALEAVLAIAAGVAARSVLLTAFGADSLIELLSGVTLLWRLRVEAGGRDSARVEFVEQRAVWISAALLILLCAYVALTSIAGFVLRIEPERSWLGVAVSAAAVVVMPWLAGRKRAANQTIQSSALRADVAESVTCAYLAGVTLIGAAINAVSGLWWVEYVAAVFLLWWLVPEAREALEDARRGPRVTDS